MKSFASTSSVNSLNSKLDKVSSNLTTSGPIFSTNDHRHTVVSTPNTMPHSSHKYTMNSHISDDFELKSQRMSELFNFKGKDKQSPNNKVNLANIYAPKVICFISLYPFFNEQLRLLRAIFKYCKKKNKLKKPVELVIQNLIIDVPCPPRGIWKV